MLLRFFRINDPYRLLGLLFILVLISLPFLLDPAGLLLSELKYAVLGEAVAEGKLMYIQIFDDTTPLASIMFGCMDIIFGKSMVAKHIIALLIIFFQAGYFAVLLISNKAYAENTYLPALIFGLLYFFSFDLITLSPELLASTMLLLALNQLFHEIEFKIQLDEIVLKLGFYLGLSTFFVFSYWVFLLLSVLILITLTRAGFRKIALMIFGFLLPHALLLTLYYSWGESGLLWRNFYLPNLTFSGEMLVSTRGLLMLGGVPLVYLLFSVFMVNREARFTKYQSQLMQVMFFWLLFALGQVLVAREISPASLVTFFPPLAYFISHYLLLIRRKWIAEGMLWIFLLGIVTMSYMSKQGRVSAVDYTKLFPDPAFLRKEIDGKKILVLEEGYYQYQRNALGGFFLNWELSKPVFEDLTDYRHIEIIASCFEMDPPEVILDRNNYMASVMERIPFLKAVYRKEGEVYWRVNN